MESSLKIGWFLESTESRTFFWSDPPLEFFDKKEANFLNAPVVDPIHLDQPN